MFHPLLDAMTFLLIIPHGHQSALQSPRPTSFFVEQQSLVRLIISVVMKGHADHRAYPKHGSYINE
jgi:hypothetical protein